jgi:hypothetical protein
VRATITPSFFKVPLLNGMLFLKRRNGIANSQPVKYVSSDPIGPLTEAQAMDRIGHVVLRDGNIPCRILGFSANPYYFVIRYASGSIALTGPGNLFPGNGSNSAELNYARMGGK